MLESLFNKVAKLVWNSTKERLQHRCFPVNVAKFLRAPEHLSTSGSVSLDNLKFQLLDKSEQLVENPDILIVFN